MPGYSATPLAKKLGIKPGSRLALIDAPPDLRDWLAPLPADIVFGRAGRTTDLVHLFVSQRALLARHLASLRKTLRDDAAVWVSWPKKSAKVATDVTEGAIRGVALPLGFVDVKVCAVSDLWSGLKLVVRKEQRTKA
ncbi:MAG TPA: DUF3052 domain-containing protein [Burkholderiaceae bacterium]|nr:DUF3052 domain-containing protein [Burkholderiaceae bacterium]